MLTNRTAALFQAIRQQENDRLADLLRQDPNLVNATDDRGSTPLVLASYLGYLPATRLLVEAGAPLDARGPGGLTALMGVCFRGYPAIARYLIEQGADVSVRNEQGGDARSFAEMSGQEEIIRLLDAQ